MKISLQRHQAGLLACTLVASALLGAFSASAADPKTAASRADRHHRAPSQARLPLASPPTATSPPGRKP
jgi:uncharacterized membrane protein (DUF4010 family)